MKVSRQPRPSAASRDAATDSRIGTDHPDICGWLRRRWSGCRRRWSGCWSDSVSEPLHDSSCPCPYLQPSQHQSEAGLDVNRPHHDGRIETVLAPPEHSRAHSEPNHSRVSTRATRCHSHLSVGPKTTKKEKKKRSHCPHEGEQQYGCPLASGKWSTLGIHRYHEPMNPTRKEILIDRRRQRHRRRRRHHPSQGSY